MSPYPPVLLWKSLSYYGVHSGWEHQSAVARVSFATWCTVVLRPSTYLGFCWLHFAESVVFVCDKPRDVRSSTFRFFPSRDCGSSGRYQLRIPIFGIYISVQYAETFKRVNQKRGMTPLCLFALSGIFLFISPILHIHVHSGILEAVNVGGLSRLRSGQSPSRLCRGNME